MSGIIYGVFDTRTQAQAAIDLLDSETHEGVNAIVHEGHMRDEDVQMSGTDAFAGAVLGAVVVGCLASLIGGLLLIPESVSIGFTEFLFIAIAGTIMGLTAGAVAGASEPRKELLAMSRKLAEGKVLVTLESDKLSPAEVIEAFRGAGALEVEAA